MPDYFLPFIGKGEAKAPYKGLAMAIPDLDDLRALEVSWYYVWGPAAPFECELEFVPMLWGGNPSDAIAADYAGPILFLNEPNLKGQANVSPSEAVEKLAVVRERYPHARIIGCGTSIWEARFWVERFLKAGGVVDAWHIHGYVESWITPEKVIDYARQNHETTGGVYWITEYNSLAGSVDELRTVTEWFMEQEWIERIAVYTNRQPTNVPWGIDKRVELFDGSRLTDAGHFYRDARGPDGRA